MNMYTNDVPYIYVKASELPDLDERHLGLLLCEAMASIVSGDIGGAMLLEGIWTIRIRTHQARATLIDKVKVVTIRNQQIELYDEYPIVTKLIPGEKVLFKDLPFEVDDRDILDYVYSCGDIQVKTKAILHARMRNHNGELTPFYSGDRFIYIKGGCRRTLPSVADIGPYRCRIFHSSQKNSCRRCLYVGHSMHETEKCNAYYEHDNMITIRSPNNVVCNYYSCPVTIYNKTFQSSEHAFQWKFCKYIRREDLADEVLAAPSPAKAKEIASRVPYHLRGNWHNHKLGVMQEVLFAKVKCCPEFEKKLIDSGSKKLVEAVKSDRFWSCGLSPRDAETTKRQYHPGQNHLGRLLEFIRSKISSELLPSPDSAHTTEPTTRVTSTCTTSTTTSKSNSIPLRVNQPLWTMSRFLSSHP